jgi:hypothetical protein
MQAYRIWLSLFEVYIDLNHLRFPSRSCKSPENRAPDAFHEGGISTDRQKFVQKFFGRVGNFPRFGQQLRQLGQKRTER